MSTPEDSSKLFHTAMGGSKTPEDAADIWRAYLEGNRSHCDVHLDEMRRALNEGNPADVIRLASQDVGARAVEAARRLRDPDERYRIDA